MKTSSPTTLEFEDFFADESGVEDPDLPQTRTAVAIADTGAGTTRMTIESHFPSPEAMAQVIEMGIEEGIKQALGQADALLADQST